MQDNASPTPCWQLAGSLLDDARHALGITPEELAERVGLDRSSYSRVKNGRQFHGLKKQQSVERTTQSLYNAVEQGFTEQSRRKFLQTLLIVGLTWPEPLLNSIGSPKKTTTQVNSTSPLSRAEADTREHQPIASDAVRLALLGLRAPIYEGKAADSECDCQTLIGRVKVSDWVHTPEGNELLSQLYVEWAHATPPDQPELVVERANEAWTYGHYRVNPAIRQRLEQSVYLVIGMTTRIMADILKAEPLSPIKQVYDDCIATYKQDTLEQAMSGPVSSVKFWAMTEYIKNCGRAGQMSAVHREFAACLRGLEAYTGEQSPTTLAILPVSLYEGRARALLQNGSDTSSTDKARRDLDDALRYATLSLNRFQVELTYVETELRSHQGAARQPAEERLRGLIATAPSSYQQAKALRLAEMYSVVVPADTR